MRKGIAIAAALVTAVAGCGGNRDGDGGLTRAQLDARSSVICNAGSAKLEKLGATVELSDPVVAARWLQSLVGVYDEEIAQSRKLVPEARLKPAYAAYLAQLTANRDFFNGVLAKARARDHSGFVALERESEQRTHANAALAAERRAGLKGCAQIASSARR
jgi:hypothetical protein